MTWLVYLTLALMLPVGALAVALAMGAGRIDAVEIGTDDDVVAAADEWNAEAAHDDANGAW